MRRTPSIAIAALTRASKLARSAATTSSTKLIEIVVVVLFAFKLVMALAVVAVGFGRRRLPEQHVDGDDAVRYADRCALQAADLPRSPASTFARPAASTRSAFEITMRSAQRSWSSKSSSTGSSCSSERSLARCSASFASSEATRPSATADSIDHGHDAVDRDAVLDARPGEGLHQRLRQRQAGRLDDDVVGRRVAAEDRLHRRKEIVGDRAADAAVGKLDDLVGAAGLAAAIGEQPAVEAHIAELVDDERDLPPAGILQEVADQRRLAGAEEAGDDRRGDAAQGFLGSGAHYLRSFQNQRQARRHEHDMVARRRQRLVQTPLRIAEAAAERVVGDEPEPDFVRDKDTKPRRRSRGIGKRAACALQRRRRRA